LLGEDKTPDQQRAEIGQMRDKTLTRLYKEEPDTEAEIAKAVGYAVFDNTGVHILVVSGGFGHGIAHDNESGKDTCMKMYTGGAGPGLGVKDYRVVFVFHTRDKFEKFLNEGWSAQGQADAAATTGEKGDEASGAVETMYSVHHPDNIPGTRWDFRFYVIPAAPSALFKWMQWLPLGIALSVGAESFRTTMKQALPGVSGKRTSWVLVLCKRRN
jgi:hypothetical protein